MLQWKIRDDSWKLKYVSGTGADSFLDVTAVNHINSRVHFQFLQARSQQGVSGVENTPTWFICSGRYCYVATMCSFWEVPGCSRIFLPVHIGEFIKCYYEIVS